MNAYYYRRPICIALFIFLFFGGVIFAKEPETKYAADAGPNKVATLVETWNDSARKRDVPVKIYYPQDGEGPFPVIVFSHGLGGTREGYEYLGEHWASCGYVSVHLQHKGSDDSAWKGKAKPLDALRDTLKNPTVITDRPADVKFVVDQLEKINAEKPPLKGKLDIKRLGMAGHSFGAWTTLAIAGEAAVSPAVRESKFADSRFKAAIAMSAPVVAANQRDRFDQVFGEIKIPILHMTGTLDDSPIGETKAAERRIPFDHISGADQYLITFTDGDHSIFAGPGLRPVNRKKGHVFHDDILISSTAFWDAYLKDDDKAKTWLAEGEFGKLLGKEGKFEKKMK
jgi:predicted dienelactone hydrolase